MKFWLRALWRLPKRCPQCETRWCTVYAADIDAKTPAMVLMHAGFRR